MAARRVRGVEVAMDEVSLRCMGCQSSASLAEAVRGNWQMCANCNFFICQWCSANRGEARFCFSYPCQRLRRPFHLGPIPVERIMIFARNSYRDSYRQGLLYRLFFEEQGACSPWTLKEPEPEKLDDTGEALLPLIQEEVWSNHKLVVTKRLGGKFITWEKIV